MSRTNQVVIHFRERPNKPMRCIPFQGPMTYQRIKAALNETAVFHPDLEIIRITKEPYNDQS